VGWRCPKSPLELSSQACGDPSSPGAGGADPPPCPPESSLRGAAASPGPPIYSLYWTIAPWDLPPGQREPSARRARGRGAVPGLPRSDPSCVLANPTGPPAFPMAAMSSHGLGLIPCPPEWDSTPPGAQQPGLRRSAESRSGGRRPTPVPTDPLELSSQACGDPPSPGAGGADLPPVGWRCPKSPLELSSQACGDPSSPGAGGADPPPCPPESSLRGAAASPGPPAPAGRIRPGLYWYPRRRVKGPSPPGTSLRGSGSRPRRARGRGAVPGLPRSDPGCVLANPTGPPAFPMAAMSSHGLGLIPCPPEWDSTPAEIRRVPERGAPTYPPVGWRCPKSPLELSSQACGDPSSPGAGGADPPPCPPESSLRGAAASPGPPAPAGRIRPGLYWTIAPWDLPPGSREPQPFPGRPRRLEGGGSSTRAGKHSTGRNSAETGPDLAKLGSPVEAEAPYPTPPGPNRGPRRSPETGANPAKLGVPLDPEAAYPTPPGPSPGPRRSPEAGANPTKLGVPLDPEAAYPTPPGPSPGPRRSPEAGANPAKLGVPLDPEAAYPTPPGPSP
ncbi:hypothetical protein M9458_050834, partial [Cirrhinus mrigala]